MRWSRRDLLKAGALLAGNAAVSSRAAAAPASPPPAGALVVSSGNGLRAVARAHELLVAGTDPIDAAVAGVNILELDPEEQGVGLGGLPNAEGVVQLDASCMHGPTRRAGAVAAIEGISTPSLVAKAVLEHTDHILLAGAGATRFARELGGFTEQDLLTPRSRQQWLRWRARLSPNDNWLEPAPAGALAHETGTVTVLARTAGGDLASVTSTSGLSWKIPGRVGDSPILGAGQYCDNEVGAAGSTDRGEANMKVCGAFLVVEAMRQGATPAEACLAALRRAVAMTEKRLLDAGGRPRFDLVYYAVSKRGAHGAAVLYGPTREEAAAGVGAYAVADSTGARLLPATPLYAAGERPASLLPRVQPGSTHEE
jgi:N4-(beta-N-acetylglucosaminyl)-L-asparaginase